MVEKDAVSKDFRKQVLGYGLTTADKGRGRTSARQGGGTRMMTALVSQLSGHMDFEDNAPGVRGVLSPPIVHQ
jgi:hypothetical protein